MSTTHQLKTWPEYFQAILREEKTFEIRRNDRKTKFKVGDTLQLREFTPCERCAGSRRVWDNGDKMECPDCDDGGTYTGNEVFCRVNYITDWQQPDGQVVMSIQNDPGDNPMNPTEPSAELAKNLKRLGELLEHAFDRTPEDPPSKATVLRIQSAWRCLTESATQLSSDLTATREKLAGAENEVSNWVSQYHERCSKVIKLGTLNDQLRARNLALEAQVGETRELQKRAFTECLESGWNPEQKNTFAEEIAHLHEEISEAFRAFRLKKDFSTWYDGTKPQGVPVELADAVIGMLYNAELHGFDLFEAVAIKLKYNKTRNYTAEGRQLHALSTLRGTPSAGKEEGK